MPKLKNKKIVEEKFANIKYFSYFCHTIKNNKFVVFNN